MTNLIKSHSFVVRKANGIDDFRVQLRAGYWTTITSEKTLRVALENAFATHRDPIYAEAEKKHYDVGNVLRVLRDFGMIAGSERLTTKNPAAVTLGALGGLAKSESKAKSSRENGKKGGRPRKTK